MISRNFYLLTALETLTAGGYTFFMSLFRLMEFPFRFIVLPAFYLMFSVFSLTVMAVTATANPDVYGSLPEDTRVVQYGLGNIDGDSGQELAVLFLSGGRTRLALFRAHSGHWVPWGLDVFPQGGKAEGSARSVELLDATGDGRDEVILYNLTPGGESLLASILSFRNDGSGVPMAVVLLEDEVSPPGYPLFGIEKGKPEVTFLRMPSGSGEKGHRRVYCWEGDRFEKCEEVEWESR
jgi:hypothetical protein